MRASERRGTRDGGFSLVELLVVIVVLGILGGIVMFGIGSWRTDSAQTTDAANVVMLNKASSAYSVTAASGEALDDLGSDTARMNKLFDKGLLRGETASARTVTPKVPGASFVWNSSGQTWMLTVGTDSTSTYNLADPAELPSGYRTVGTWTKSASGGFTSVAGLLFIGNPRSEFTANVTATLGTANTWGGYGVNFNTSLTPANSDTGFVLQFDRGYNAGTILIRPRANGIEQGPASGFLFTAANTGGFVPDKNTPAGAAWWSAEHTLTLKVTAPSATQRNLEFQIDGHTIFNNFTYGSPVAPADNFIGLRTWSGPSVFKTVTISGTPA